MDSAIVGMVEDELRRISDRGELASRAVLREMVGLGAADLEQALDALREQGRASEVEPDGFRAGVEPEPELPDVSGGSHSAADAEELRERAARWTPPPLKPGEADEPRMLTYAPVAQVTMPRAVAAVLDAEALGQLLKAGIDASAQDAPFIFEVTP